MFDLFLVFFLFFFYLEKIRLQSIQLFCTIIRFDKERIKYKIDLKY